MKRNSSSRFQVVALLMLSLLLAACSSSDGGNNNGGQNPPGVGLSGGTVMGPNGAQVTIPAGALASGTSIAVTQSNTGAPPLPAGFSSFGQMFSFTPHGTSFAMPATVIVPFDPASLPAGATPVLYKTNGQNQWEPVPGATFSGGIATAQVSAFSFFLIGNQPPQITRQPVDVAVVEPNTASFSVVALGTPPFSYQWQRSDDGGATFADVPGSTADAYTTGNTSVGVDDGDRYRVLVRNLEGTSTSQAARLTVTAAVAPPVIDSHPQAINVVMGGSASFTVTATGPNLQYQWQRSNDGGTTFTDIAGATNASFVLTNVQAADNNAQFRARVSNTAGNVTSNAATLTVGTTPPPPPVTAARLAAGGGFSLARNAAGSALSSWGSDSGEALGNGGGGSRNVPGPLPLPGFMPQPATAIAAGSGSRHGLMISDGTAWAWGYNGFGQIGNGGTNSQPNPVPMTHDNGFVITGAVGIAAGTLHSLVLRNDGAVFAVGANSFGQLGDGTNNDRLRAVAVPGLTNITALAAGGQFSLALRADGTVWAWGANSNGQLGDGTTTDRNTPVQVAGLAGVTAIAAGSEHALALLGSGGVVAWGLNSEGQLGDDTTIRRTSPVNVLGFSRAFTIAAGGNNSAAFGEVFFTWGSNSNGQLGSGSAAPAFRAVAGPVPALSGPVTGFSVGGNHMLAVLPDGTVQAWGANDSGQAGNGTTGGNVLAPVPVSGLNVN